MTDSSNPLATWTRSAWLVVILLWPVAMLNYLDRQMLGTMKKSIVADVQDVDTDAKWGIALGSFKWVYAILSPFAGFVGDRVSRRHVISLSLLMWSLATWGTGHVSSYEQLLAMRALMGVSEAFYFPTALAMIADYHVGPTRAMAVGIHQTGIYIGAIIGSMSGFVADNVVDGWRWAFYACGVVGIVYTIPLFAFLRNKTVASQDSGDQRTGGAPITDILANRNFLLLVLYFTLPGWAGWVIRDWGPIIIGEKFQFTQGMSGIVAVAFVQIAALIGATTGGLLSDRAMRRTIRGRIYISACGMALFLPALVGIGSATSIAVVIASLVIFGIGWGFFDCNNMPILCQIVTPKLRATAYGIMNLVSISLGGIADWQYGRLRDQKVPDSTIFGWFTAVAMISLVVVLLIRPNPSLVGTEQTGH